MKKIGTVVISVALNSLQHRVIKDWPECRDGNAFMEGSGKLLYIYVLTGSVK